MKNLDVTPFSYNNKNNLVLLRALSLIASIFTIVISYVLFLSSPNLLAFIIVTSIVFSGYFALFIMSFVNPFVRNRAALFLFIMYYVSMLLSISHLCFVQYSEIQVWLLIMIIFLMVLIVKKMRYFYITLATLLPAVMSIIILKTNDSLEKYNLLIIFAFSLLVAYINLRTILKTERELSEIQSRYEILVESTLMGVFLYQDDKLIYCNPFLERLLGYTLQELNAMDYSSYIFHENKPNSSNSIISNSTDSLRIKKKDGTTAYLELHKGSIIYNGRPATIGNVLDTSHLKKADEKIKHLAFYDALTDLPNRVFLKEYLNNLLSNNGDISNKPCIMFIDLDKFKYINDTFGHDFGDKVLKIATERLLKHVGQDSIVSRYGGDEFIVVLNNMDEAKAKKIAQQIIDGFAEPFRLNEHEVFTSPSIGLSFYPIDGDNAEDLIKNADIAMYLAKAEGRNNYQVFSNKLNETVSRKLVLENGLRKALANNEFLLHYQPQVDLQSGKVCGMEALLRWKHPSLGFIPPLEFIPLAEDSGLINSIGRWVLETACWQSAEWQKSGLPSVPIGVNISGIQLQAPNFIEIVKDVLKKTKLRPELLVLEITESIMQNPATASKTLDNLSAIGVKVAIDDFGTGYSSLNLLKNLNIDILKIDKSFIDDITINNKTLTFLKVIIELGKIENFEIIIEGIETLDQAVILSENKCTIGQGYFFSRPLSSITKENFEPIKNIL
jgi:diguanylate cyclase (GGDEF)-like protein/PAS domain S-box-containing protein